MKRFTCGIRACFLAVAFFSCAASARGEDVWRLAGTFNGWNTGDDAWAMKPAGEGRYEIVRPIKPASYAFKFVKNGAWERGHLGAAAGGAHSLEMPGADNKLRIVGEASYRVTLDVNSRDWSFGMVAADKPVVVMRALGEAVVGQDLVIDLTESVWPEGAAPAWSVSAGGAAHARMKQIGEERRYLVRPTAPGALEITATLKADGQISEKTLRFEANREPAPTKGRVVEFRPNAGAGALKVWAVHIAGDFNGWAGPGDVDEIAMRSRVDGSFFVGLTLPDGAYRYRFIVNESDVVLDPANAGAVSRAADGSPASVLAVGKTAEQFPAARPNEINSEAVRHDPKFLRDFRCVSEDLGLFDISVCTLPGDVEQAFVHIDADEKVIGEALPVGAFKGGTGRKRLSVPMHRTTDLSGFDRWSARVLTGIKGESVTYALAFKDGSAELITRDFSAEAKPTHHLPAWAMGAVWYQIFPDRFRNGNPLNDPHGPGVTLMPWNSDWYAVSDEESAAWKKRAGIKPDAPMPRHQGGPLYNVVWDRRYGGDLQGIEEKLGYLKDLGVTAIYMNPIFEAESMHKYDATDYRHIDDNFGQPASAGRVAESWTHLDEPADPSKWKWTPADRYFVDGFLPAAKKAGLRVVLDGVFNHTGRPFWAFADIEKNGAESLYKDYFFVEFDPAGKLKSWVSWFNTGALPKFRQESNGDLVEPVKRHIFDITTRWMDPNGDGDPSDGIDGWRLDVALDVGLPFWRDWRKHVKSINPDAIIIAEIWDDASEHVKGDTFDTQMHYPFAKPVTDWLGVRPGMTSVQLEGRLRQAFDDSPQTNLIHQNLFGSHDTDRFVSMLHNPGREYDGANRLQDGDGRSYKGERPPKRCYDLSLLGVAMQATYLGAPMVYYGDEVGMYGADDPTDRKPFPWPDTGEPMNPSDAADWAIHKEYARWLGLRHDGVIGPVLKYGTVRHLTTGRDDVFAFTRELNGKRVVVAVNRSDTAFDATVLLPEGTPDALCPGMVARYWVLE